MPSNWSIVDATFPTFRGDEQPRQQISALINYMQVLTEQLKYSLDNLDTDNWNTAALQTLTDDTASAAARKLSGLSKELEQLRNEVAALSGRVSDFSALPGRMTAIEEDLSYLQQDVEEHGNRLEAAEDLIDTAEADIDGLQTDMEDVQTRLQAAEENAASLGKSFTATEQGANVGGEGQIVNLVGTIYINGVLYEQESGT